MFDGKDLPDDGESGVVEYAEQFHTLLRQAAALVGPPWFHMSIAPIDEGPSQRRYRERVYCYELYHQIRTLSTGEIGRLAGAPRLLLSGELDKSGINSVVRNGLQKPDLVWHEPGSSHNNAVVVEVKSTKGLGESSGMEKSLATLRDFLQAGPRKRYQSGILLIFGHGSETTVFRAVRRNVKAHTWNKETLRRVRVVWHASVGHDPSDFGSLTSVMRPGSS